MKINLSTGESYDGELQVWDDLSVEKPGFYRLFWADKNNRGVPAIGLCNPSGTHKTIKAAIEQGIKLYGIKAVRVR